ncbi:PadR family transcriptional regulator [Nocardioides sp. cx-173]|uniref:PadR family transcriptional regulator n=1 Tax=Nocardioides sp. cx-173 TaxID=2898796 RepID=UPI001E4F093B|nr:PadR family transcriptional regulator [Nocardioides sp. cx-173]MCD4523849.1 PadR family transcriptional regulator [Nocardioides sp. cx-173]UGB41831.1 PadR family transcriptional regulator [Nocardioides sp. cx-173]
MALEHALLVALRERPASGLELAKRFSRSIGFFWSATHQQIYRVLARMEADGWLAATTVAQAGKPDKKVYDVTPAGAAALAQWLAAPTPPHALRSDLAVKMRGASFGDREAVLDVVRAHLADHHARLEHYRRLMERDYPAPDNPASLSGLDLDHYLVLRGGILTEETWVTWLTEYLEAHA